MWGRGRVLTQQIRNEIYFMIEIEKFINNSYAVSNSLSPLHSAAVHE